MPRTLLLAAFLTLLAVGLAALPAGAANPVRVLPDLVADPVTGPHLQEYGSPATRRRLLRFTGYVHNDGAGAAAVTASTRVGTVMQTRQQVVDVSTGGTTLQSMPGRSTVRWEPEDGHDHWHLGSAARYSLRDQQGARQIGVAEKVGFCLLDSDPVGSTPWSSRQFTEECSSDDPEATDVTMGVSAGWRDVYAAYLAFQWVDVSDVQPGNYLIRSEVDPEDVIDESDESNAPASVPVTIPGWSAEPSAASSPDGRAVEVPLRATRVGEPRLDPQFRIEDPPARGTLSVPAGEWFTGPLTYTPAPGSDGADTFTVSARETSAAFPRSPARAPVTVTTGTAHALAISGAPAAVRTRAIVPLRATVTRGSDPSDPGPVSWSVDVGRISGAGVYVAPAEVPAAGRTATVRATTPSGLLAEARMLVRRRPKAQPAPVAGGRGRGVHRLAAERVGSRLVVSARPRRTGRLRLTLVRGSRPVTRCTMRVIAARSYSCRFPVRRDAGTTLVATLRARGGRLIGQRLRVPARPARAAAHAGPGHGH